MGTLGVNLEASKKISFLSSVTDMAQGAVLLLTTSTQVNS